MDPIITGVIIAGTAVVLRKVFRSDCGSSSTYQPPGAWEYEKQRRRDAANYRFEHRNDHVLKAADQVGGCGH